MKPSRRRKGATLGLVAACVLVIIVLGIGVFFLAKLFGGGREVANATDAGTLNLAKNALITPNVTLSTVLPGNGEFNGCSYNLTTGLPDGTIDLFTYNRCVAQALLVAMNAKAETDVGGATSAMGHASQMLTDLNTLGTALSTALANNTALQGNFTNSANRNNVNMFGDTTVAQTGYQTAYMKAGGATNVFFYKEAITADAPGGTQVANYPTQTNSAPYKLGAQTTNSPDPLVPDPYLNLTGKYYLQGYNGITVSAGGTTLTYFGVPVFPQQKPHLVSLADFNSSGAGPAATPPNSFKVESKAQDKSKTGNFGGAIACAIVGSAFNGSGGGVGTAISPDFPVAIPTGYIEFVNPGGNTLGANFLPVDNSNNIFNNELFNGTGGGLPTGGAYGVGGSDLWTGNAANGGVFGDQMAIQAWATYNAGVVSPGDTPNATTNPGGMSTPLITGSTGYFQANLFPPSLANVNVGKNSPPTASGTTGASPIYDSNGNIASLTECLSITGTADDCTLENTGNGNGLLNNCLTFLNNPTANPAFLNAYGHPMPISSGSPPGGVSAVDTIKGAILANFNGAGYHQNINISASAGTINSTTDLGNGVLSVSQDGNPGGPGNGLPTSTGLGEYMGPAGLNDVYAAYGTGDPNFHDTNAFPIQNTGQAVPSGAKPSILGLLSQLDSGNGPAMSTTNPNLPFNACSSVYASILQRVQQIQPKITDSDLRGLLNGAIETYSGGSAGPPQYGLQMGQTAIIYLNNGNLNDATGVKGLHICAVATGTTPPPLANTYTGKGPDGTPGSSNASGATAANGQCGESYSLYKGGAGLVDVSINGNQAEVGHKGDDYLHDQPYTYVNPGGEYTATDTGKWTPSSGYGNILGRLNFSDVVSGNASFSAPN